VSLGPGLVILVNGLVALSTVRFFRQKPDQWTRLREQPVARWFVAVPLYLLLSPVAGARWERAVILRSRSALWGRLVSPVGWLKAALMTGTVHRAARARRG
jgi:hypothetical protein